MTDPLTGKRVTVVGLARQGMAAAKWLCSIGARVTVTDLSPAEKLKPALEALSGLDITYYLGENPPQALSGADAVCLSGGVPLDVPIVQEALRREIRLTNDAQLFIERCPCHVVGITGSAGKTTTTALTGKMCDAAGMLAWVGGNIGNPLLEDLRHIRPSDLVVMELSSFQLEIMTASPHVAAILNITPNHLDRHKTMEVYVEAKARILDNQLVGDIAVLGRDDPQAYALQERVQEDLVLFSGQVPVDVGAWLAGEKIMCRPKFTLPMEMVCTREEIPLRGYHNVLNVLAACAIAGAAEVPVEAMREAVLAFQPVEHRLEVVRDWGGILWVNDSIATAPERVIAALEAYDDRPVVLLLGGRDKKLPWEELIRLALRRCRAIITFGEAGLMIATKVAALRSELGLATPLEQADRLPEVVEMASELAQVGDVVLLAPGCTSFDAYVDFAARGEHFRKLVMGL